MRLAGALPDTATRLGAGLDFCRPRSKPMFAGVYRAGTGGFLLWDGNWASFQAKWQDASHQGLRLLDLSCY